MELIIFIGGIGIIFFLLVFFVILLLMRMPGRHRGKQKLIAVDSVGNLIFTSLSRRKWIQPHGDGHEAYQAGMGKKPIALSGDTYQLDTFANCTLNVNESFLKHVDSFFVKRCHELEYTVTRLESELSVYKSDLFKLESEMGRTVDARMEKRVKDVKSIMPVMMMKRSARGGAGGGGGNYGGN